MKESNNLRHLQNMLLAINRLEEFTKEHSLEDAMDDYRISDVILLEFENVANSANRLDADYKARHSEIPFFKITSIRNRIAHDYLSVSLETLYETVENDFEEFKSLIIKLINQEQTIIK